MSGFTYISKSLPDRIDNMAIQYIVATAYNSTGVMRPDDIKRTNHWLLFLVRTTDNEPKASIRLDPLPGSDNELLIIASPRDYEFTAKAIKIIKVPISGLTFGAFVHLIETSKYDQYKFSDSGQGCRWWILRVFQLLAAKGFVESVHVETAEDILSKVWVDDKNLVAPESQTGFTKGTFVALNEE